MADKEPRLTSQFEDDVHFELIRARNKFTPITSPHEGYAIILEELDEFWTEVKGQHHLRNDKRMYDELMQVAAMCQRTAEDALDVE